VVAGVVLLVLATVPAVAGTGRAGAVPVAPAQVAPPGDGWFSLVNRHSGKALDVLGSSTADGADVVQWSPHGGANQQWRFVDSGGGWYRLVNRHSGRALDVLGFSTAAGADVVQWTDLNGTNQQWRLTDTGGGHVSLLNRHSGQALEIWTWSTADGGDAVQWPATAGANQQWRLVPAGGGGGGGGVGRQMEDLDRGLVSVRSGAGNHVSWRLLGTDPAGVAFNLYRGGTRVNAAPLTGATSYTDAGAPAEAAYTVRPVAGGVEQAPSAPARNLAAGHLDVPISVPGSGYTANDASVGDLDGDGDYEIVLKWDPSNSRDNSQAGVTGNVYVDAYDLSGARLWRIDLGRNIRAGAHYTQFMVYDLDGDGRSEVAMKTADGTRSGTGQVVGNAGADHRNAQGYILTGPEYLTVFDGRTGAILATAGYVPARGSVSAWGDDYGNRVDRFLTTVAYLDGQRPSLVFSRGYYTRTVLAAWHFRDGRLTQRWVFDSNTAPAYAGQGNHNISVADVDADGRDEIMFGAMAVDDDGRGLWSTGYGHGDAYHVGDLDPDRPGLEVFDIQERVGTAGAHLDDARTGATVWRKPSASGATEGPGRGVAADIWAGSRGAEMWVSGGGLSGRLWSRTGAELGRAPGSTNFVVWWDGDPVRELLDGVAVDRYGPGGDQRLLTGSGVAANNGTKATPALSADLFGDWREEVVWRTADSRALRIYATTAPTDRRITTLMHDPQYRMAVAWQNVAYNQPPHPSFYLGDGMATPPRPAIYVR
jgi:hypothetical protein